MQQKLKKILAAFGHMVLTWVHKAHEAQHPTIASLHKEITWEPVWDGERLSLYQFVTEKKKNTQKKQVRLIAWLPLESQ